MDINHYVHPWQLKKAQLFTISEGVIDDNLSLERANYDAPVSMSEITAEIEEYAERLRVLGVEVDCTHIPVSPHVLPNVIFASDNIFSYGGTMWLPGMSLGSRRREQEWLYPIMTGRNASKVIGIRWESSDVLLMDNRCCLVGLGNRTEPRVVEFLHGLDIEPIYTIHVPRNIQHLMGLIRPVGPHTMAIRSDIMRHQDVNLICSLFDTIHVRETSEVKYRQAFNFVPIDRRKIILPNDVPNFTEKMQRRGVTTYTVDIHNLRRAGGGLACLTGRIA